jgi:hypothetical protein
MDKESTMTTVKDIRVRLILPEYQKYQKYPKNKISPRAAASDVIDLSD